MPMLLSSQDTKHTQLSNKALTSALRALTSNELPCTRYLLFQAGGNASHCTGCKPSTEATKLRFAGGDEQR